mmetsp:Transcript_46040/g.107653  ORF Transcript_46040/g.107653 Transcript_46040/m.107653 type:complete len:203 (+) Transcript_46040:1007-1615(+)
MVGRRRRVSTFFRSKVLVQHGDLHLGAVAAVHHHGPVLGGGGQQNISLVQPLLAEADACHGRVRILQLLNRTQVHVGVAFFSCLLHGLRSLQGGPEDSLALGPLSTEPTLHAVDGAGNRTSFAVWRDWLLTVEHLLAVQGKLHGVHELGAFHRSSFVSYRSIFGGSNIHLNGITFVHVVLVAEKQGPCTCCMHLLCQSESML